MLNRFRPSTSLRPRSLAVALIALGAMAGLAAVPATAPAWRADGPNGGPPSSFAFAPSDAQRVYAVNFFGGVFRSDDGGLSFERLEPSNPFSQYALVVDPQDRDRVLSAACNPFCTHVVLSEDAGATWTEVLADQSLFGLRFGDGAAFATTAAGLLRSDDGGVNWSPSGLAELVDQLAFDPHHSGSILAAVAGGLWRSADHGHSWTRLRTPRNWRNLTQVSFDPVRPGTLYAIANSHAVRSTDGGATWQLALSSPEVWRLAVLGDGTVLATPIAAEDDRVFGLLRSSDGGRTWSPSVDPGNPRTAHPADWILYGVAASPSPRVALAGGSFGLWRTEDSGTTWQPASRGIASHSVFTLRASAGGEPRVYAAMSTGFFAREERSGVWHKTYRGPIVPGAALRLGPFRDVQVDPQDSLHLVAFDVLDLLESRDGGRSWRSFRPLDAPLNDYTTVAGFAVDWTSGAIYGTAWEIGSGPQGVIWRQRIGVTRDGGRTWERLRPFFSDGPLRNLDAFAVDPHDPSILWAKTAEAGILRSIDRGHHWQRIGRGLPRSPDSYLDFPAPLAFDPGDPRTLLAALPGAGIWRSRDGGLSFRPLGKGLETVQVTDLASAPDSTGALRWFAGVANQGIFRLEGDRWQPVGRFSDSHSFGGNFVFDPVDPQVLYAGTSGRSVLRLDLRER
ncbi:MAG TPA: hypothetical protein VGS22_07465 [Thermoanaerobaculia bacterium]|jgi:photosystem II stability/assembly factor-like uncharacterized protein|nr:hypothetical protein [Thermoanaerobaculia bacterium]